MRIIIEGTVQGVGFRPMVQRVACSLGLKGRVWNDGSKVMIDVDDADALVDGIKRNLPPLAVIDRMEVQDSPVPDCDSFTIVHSENRSRGVSIPTDTAVCDECLKEMRSEGRRKGYAFTTCTNCGARFTLLSSLPYDRENTAMRGFPMCDSCRHEYTEMTDRRFHHQTVCCPDCGPRYRILDSKGMEIDGDPIPTFARYMDSGKIGIAKSWGGMHICTVLENIDRLREWYGRKEKPFAVMVRDLDAAERYVNLTPKERELLTSPNRPIVLVDKRSEDICRGLAPGLDNVGIFLPYTGMQHILFDCLEHDALIMTSANLPGEPMVLDDNDIMSLGADLYLLHDQTIINRADDSVVRAYGDVEQIIRKSRGYIPSYITTPSKHSVVGVGAQENLTATIASDGRMYTTQHIGNGESLGVVDYLESATDSFIDLLGCRPEAIAMDLHPGYANRRYAKALSERYGANLIEVQHHWAHAASLMAENDVSEAVVISVDGTGHGDDGQAWGGEVLRTTFDHYDRLAHLEYIPLIGSERALYDIKRLKFAIDEINGMDTGIVPEKDAEVMRKIARNSVRTSSLGRILDALSYWMGVCDMRTYDGEPAMRMEPLLRRGKMIEGFGTYTESGVVMTAHLFKDAHDGAKKEDVAYSIVRSIMDEMVNVACDDAQSKGIDVIGITGGVSYNGPITRMFEDAVRSRGMRPMLHTKVPNGDGGISVGQAAIALNSLE